MDRRSHEPGDTLAAFRQRHYLAMEAQESTEAFPGSGFSMEAAVQNVIQLSGERRKLFIRAFRREATERCGNLPRFFQPWPQAVILRDGEPFWGRFWVDGNYYADEGSCWRARRDSIDRAHGDALREDARRASGCVEITPAGRQALRLV